MIKVIVEMSERGYRVLILEYCGDKLLPHPDEWRQIGFLEPDELELVDINKEVEVR